MTLQDLTELLKGKKTYLAAAAIVAVSLLYAFGAITQEQLLTLLAILNGAGLSALRAGVEKKK